MVSLRRACSTFRTALWDLCFPKEVTDYIDPFVRFIFTVYHLPPIALVVAITHSALERIVWVLIVPVAQDMEKQPYNSSHMTTFIGGVYNIFVRILPYSTLGISVATLGHKVLNCFVETMVDAHSTHQGKDYPLLAARLRFMMEDRQRYYTFLIVLVLLISMGLSVLYTSVLVEWPEREPVVVEAVWCTIAVQFLFVVGSVISHGPFSLRSFGWKRLMGLEGGAFGRYFCGIWWETYIHYMRYIAIEMVIIMAVISLYSKGPLFVLTASVELIMYLNMPHLLGHAVMSVSTTIINLQRSLQWLRRHPDAILPVLMVALPYQTVLLQSMYFFRHYWMTVMLFVGVNVLLSARAIDLVREFDVTKAGSVHWKRLNTNTLLPPHLSIVLEDAYEARLSEVAVVSIDLLMDVKAMKLYFDGEEVPIERTQVVPYGNARSFLRNGLFYAYAVPRLLSVQSAGYFGGERFRRVRVVLRMVTVFCLLLFAALVCGILLQAAFPSLRPWPVRAYLSEDMSAFTIDHIVVRMHLMSNQANFTPHPPYTSSTATEPAFSAFKWSNATTLSEDWYPSLCTRSFYGVSIWEISLLALAPYLFNEEEVNEMLRFMSMHMGTDWVIRERHGTDCITVDSSTVPTGWDGFFDFYSAKNDVSVIAVRGTDMTSAKDLLIDVNLFIDAVLYHFLSSIVPGAVVLPSELIADLLRLASLPATSEQIPKSWESLVSKNNTSLSVCENNNYRRDFFVDVINHIGYVGSRPSRPKNVLLTGHSLGGAVASIIGAQMGIQAVGFSTPGISLSHKRFGIDLQRIHRYVVTIVSSHDIFPMIGGSGGEEHHVECLAKTRELCHAMEFLVGTLWRSCGSIRSLYPSIESVV
ncbi:hypothetical protein DQ04_01191110 [Trypanosoma grayi]|uniref:hypothetical protein n=1 Tax=Trypanosoma grayi TaxID=71804 RepID=UPI0004F48FE7|nr:hypothetical protein DQ04_01191110 [Trypanosoma grayi]KEG13143.1 hypothetical protein DQ04_01191110 [Trypanosoma grayi]